MLCNALAAKGIIRSPITSCSTRDHSFASAFAEHGIGREGGDGSVQRGQSVIYDCFDSICCLHVVYGRDGSLVGSCFCCTQQAELLSLVQRRGLHCHAYAHGKRTSGQSNLTQGRIAAAHMDDSVLFARLRQCCANVHPHLIHGFWRPPSSHPKRHLLHFSLFCTSHDRESLYYGSPLSPSKLPLRTRDLGPI